MHDIATMRQNLLPKHLDSRPADLVQKERDMERVCNIESGDHFQYCQK